MYVAAKSHDNFIRQTEQHQAEKQNKQKPQRGS